MAKNPLERIFEPSARAARVQNSPLDCFERTNGLEPLPSPPEMKKPPEGGFFISGGEGGIRTRGKFDPSHAFQACDLNRSSTSPEVGAIVQSIL
jgi:hypothetical protein